MTSRPPLAMSAKDLASCSPASCALLPLAMKTGKYCDATAEIDSPTGPSARNGLMKACASAAPTLPSFSTALSNSPAPAAVATKPSVAASKRMPLTALAAAIA